MLLMLLMSALAFFAFYLLGKLFRRKARTLGETATDPLTHHVEEQLVLLVGDKLDLDPDALAASLNGSPDADIVTEIEKSVDRVELVFERKPGKGANRIDLSVEVLFSDGKLERRINEVNVGWLPTAVRDRLFRTGAARAHETWLFPWQRGR
jgi:hypothetical protein